MSTIIRMTRYGRIWRIVLDCDHVIERDIHEAKKQQLYVEKRIGCEQCAAEAEKE